MVPSSLCYRWYVHQPVLGPETSSVVRLTPFMEPLRLQPRSDIATFQLQVLVSFDYTQPTKSIAVCFKLLLVCVWQNHFAQLIKTYYIIWNHLWWQWQIPDLLNLLLLMTIDDKLQYFLLQRFCNTCDINWPFVKWSWQLRTATPHWMLKYKLLEECIRS
jgi:hypothetical protein